MIAAERKSAFQLTIDTPYLTFTGEQWGVCGEDFEENWSRYNGIALYEYWCSNWGHVNMASVVMCQLQIVFVDFSHNFI